MFKATPGKSQIARAMVKKGEYVKMKLLVLLLFFGVTHLSILAKTPHFFIGRILNNTSNAFLITGLIQNKSISVGKNEKKISEEEIAIFDIFGNTLGQLKIVDPTTHEKRASVDIQLSYDNRFAQIGSDLYKVAIQVRIPENNNPVQNANFLIKGGEPIYFDLILRGNHLETSQFKPREIKLVPGA